MNVASLELCKELYELTGWGNSASDITEAVWRFEELATPRTHIADGNTPAYSLGYLLRKLPDHTSIYKSVRVSGVQYWAEERSYSIETEYYDTPEDAAAKLAIELFKQGILAKELPNDHTN